MSTCKFTQIIEATECIGDSLPKINNNFAILDTELCNLKNIPFRTINSSTINLFYNTNQRSLSGNIPNQSINTIHLALSSVTNDRIANGVITSNKLAPGTLTGNNLTPGTITEGLLAKPCVGTDNLKDGAVTNPKVSPNAAIDGSKINPNFGNQTVTARRFIPNIGGPTPSIGMFSQASNELNFSVNTTNILSIAQSQIRVGGNNNPFFFEVNGSGAGFFTGIRIWNNNTLATARAYLDFGLGTAFAAASIHAIKQSDGSTDLALQPSNITGDRFNGIYIDGSTENVSMKKVIVEDRVGIGTNQPISRLHVDSASSLIARFAASTGTGSLDTPLGVEIQAKDASAINTRQVFVNATNEQNIPVTSISSIVRTNGSGEINFNITAPGLRSQSRLEPLLTLAGNGGVGIGSTSTTPTDTLDVAGNLRVGNFPGGNPIRFTSGWSGFTTATNRAEIANDTDGYRSLMIVGNKSLDGNTRRVSVWDELNIQGRCNIIGGSNSLFLFGSGSTLSPGINVYTTDASNTNFRAPYYQVYNEAGIPVSGVFFNVNTNGSSSVDIVTTPPGSRISDRRHNLAGGRGIRINEQGYLSIGGTVSTTLLTVKSGGLDGPMPIEPATGIRWSGIHAWDVYANGSIACGINGSVNSVMNRDGFLEVNGGITIRNSSPTLYLRDTNQRSSMLHCNNNTVYILGATGNDSTQWQPLPNGEWPLAINLENGSTFAGGNLIAYGGGVYASGWNNNPNQGVLFLNRDLNRMLYHDGHRYNLPGAELFINGKIALTTDFVLLPNVQTVAGNTFEAGTTGYIRFSSGLIIQWGFQCHLAGNRVVTFPIAFPNYPLTLLCTDTNSARYSYGATFINNSSFRIWGPGLAWCAHWFAIGF